MGVTLLKLYPMGVTVQKLTPMGVTVQKLIPMGVTVHRLLSVFFDEDEEEEDEAPLIRKNSRHYRGSRGDSDIPSPALSALVSLQGLSIPGYDQTLEDVVPEDMLSEPTADDMMDVCSEIPDVGLEVSRAVSSASSTLEGSLRCQEVGQDYPTPMEVTEDPSILEVTVAENPAPKGGAGSYPAPKGVVSSDSALVGSASCDPALEGVAGGDPAQVGGVSCNPAPEGVQMSSPSHTSMDVHVGSYPPQSDGVMAMHASLTSSKQVALEVGKPDARILISAGVAESTPDNILQVVPVDLPSSSYNAASSDLGLPSFFSNLQVTQLFRSVVPSGKLSSLYSFVFDHRLWLTECPLS
jgi:hypothetical protein